MKNKILSKQELIEELAWTLHYESWYKESIEGKFGLNSDGTGSDHGRFRKSKDNGLDKEFIESLEFDENGESILKDEHGNPYYKMIDGEFYVDSAIKGFDFLPPSWKKENIEAAKEVLFIIEHCIKDNLRMDDFLIEISAIIHKAWVARQIVGTTGMDYDLARFLGTITVEEVKGIESHSFEHSELFKRLGAETLKNIWGYENFVDFEHLPYEEQIKDINQILYGLKLLNSVPNEISDSATEKGYSLKEQQENVENAIEDFKTSQKD